MVNKKIIIKAFCLLLTTWGVLSCSKDTVEGDPEYLAENMILAETEEGTKMFFLDHQNGTVSVTYDLRDPMHSSSGTTSQYYKGVVTIPSSIHVNGNSMQVVGITESAFMNCTQLTKLVVPSTVKSIGKMAFYNCQSLEELNIPEGVTELPEYCFSGCKALEAITLPASIERLKRFSFNSCNKLKQVTLPDRLTVLDDSVFYNCTGLLTAFLPETMTTLGAGSFAGCRNMIEVTLPESVVNIGAGCFCSVDANGKSNWKNFTLNVKATVPPVLKASISNAYSRRRIVVPRGYRDAYLAAAFWNEFTQIMERNY